MQSRSSNYFEGILQLRNVSQEVLDYSIKVLQSKENASVAKVKKVINGFDIYMAPQTFLRSLGNKLKSRFGGQLLISKRLHTKNNLTSKEVFRVNALFRLPNFKVGDIIDYRGDKIRIMAIRKGVYVKYLKTGKTKNIDFKELNPR